MVKIQLRCNDKRFPKGNWLLVLQDQSGTLTDSEGMARASFPRSQAEARFVFPSFWESVKDLRMRTDDGNLISFVRDDDSISEIKTYLEGALAARGPEAVQALGRKGWLQVIAGLCITVLAVFVMVASIARAFSDPQNNSYYVTIGATLLGLFLLARGIAALTKARRAGRALGQTRT